ncbi:uncharacterized protein [Ptychodera flava]|uniref:uncharacterized protein n=1 Tax=Ptychodera flava TaxID=63121 RepID=UPI00396A431B
MDDKLIEFLKSRCISSEVVEKLQTEKIDPLVVVSMDDMALSRYFSSPGDRLAVFEFCRRLLTQVDAPNKEKQPVLVQKFKKKVRRLNRVEPQESEMPDGVTSSERNKQSLINKNTHKRVEFRWFNYEYDTNAFKQIHAKTGNSAAIMFVNKSIQKSDLLHLATEYFFPNGISAKGKIDDFDFDIRDKYDNDIDENATVGEMGDKSRFRVQRFRMVTTKKKLLSSELSLNNEYGIVTVQSNNTDEANGGLSANLQEDLMETPMEQSPMEQSGEGQDISMEPFICPDGNEGPPGQSDKTVNPIENDSYDSNSTQRNCSTMPPQACNDVSNIEEIGSGQEGFQDGSDPRSLSSDPYQSTQCQDHSDLDKTRRLLIHRSNIVDDMLNAFSDPDIIHDYPNLSSCYRMEIWRKQPELVSHEIATQDFGKSSTKDGQLETSTGYRTVNSTIPAVCGKV